MSTTAEKLTYLNDTKGLIKDNINLTGAGLTNQTPFRQYATDLKTALLNILNNGIDTLYNNFPKTTGTGTNISLNNTLQAPMRSVINGDTEQDGEPTPENPQEIKSVTGLQKVNVCGKNLFDGVYYQTYTGGSSPYPYASNSACRSGIIKVQPNTTYTISKEISNRCRISQFAEYPVVNSSNAISYIYPQNEGSLTEYTLTTESTTQYLVIQVTNNSQENVKMQVELGSTATTYEPYQSQEYDINLGKNLFDKDNTTLGRIDTSGVVATISGYYTSDFIKVEPNTTYTKNSPTSDAYHRFAFYSSNDTSTFISTSNNNTIITPSNCNYLRFCGIDTEVNTAQLEKGIEATSYSPYFTPIHLRKSQDGTYSDYIQGTPNNWSIKRQIGSVVLDGTNYKCTYMFNNGSFYVYDTVNSQTIRNCVKSNNNLGILSNYLISNTYTNVFTNGVVGICSNGTLGELCVNLGITTSKNDINNWLSTHNTIIDYPLATETTEPITNTELIEDLNNFYNAKSYNGQTNISVEGDLPMILDVSAIIGD